MSLGKKTSKFREKLEIEHSIKSIEPPFYLNLFNLQSMEASYLQVIKDAVSKSHTKISSNGKKNR